MKHSFLALVVCACAVGCGPAPNAKAPAAGGGSDEAASGGSSEPAAGGSDSAAAAPAPASAPKPTIKDAALEKRAMKMDFDLTLTKKGASAGVQSGSWSISEERTYEVREVGGDAITAMQVLYGRRVAKPLLGIEQPSYTENKTYRVAGKGGTPTVTRDDQPAPDNERDAVLAEYGWVGAKSPLVVMLSGAKPGASLQPPVDARRALVGDIPSIDENNMDVGVVYKGTGSDPRPYADLAVTAKGPLKSGDMTFDLDLTGPARIDLATGWVTNLALSGKVKAHGTVKVKKKSLDATGTGTMTVTRSATFH